MQETKGVGRSVGMVQEIEVQTKGSEVSGLSFSCPSQTSFTLHEN